MKRVAILAAILLAPAAAAASVVHVTTREIEMGGGAAYLVFNYDDGGDAWVEERDYNGFTSGDWTTTPKFALPKLRFDPASRQILYGAIVCAKVVPMATSYSVYATGRCRLHSSIRDLGPDGPRLESVDMEVH